MGDRGWEARRLGVSDRERQGVDAEWGASAFKILDRGPTYTVAHSAHIQVGNGLAVRGALQV